MKIWLLLSMVWLMSCGLVYGAISSPNTPPVAYDDSGYSVDEDGSLIVEAAGGVLVNDTDAENDTLTALKKSDPQHGDVTLNPDGGFTYTPAENYSGTDTFTYKANDGTNDSNVATVTITVAPVNDAPVAADDSDSTDEDAPLTIHVLQNDADVENDPLTIASTTQGSHGTVAINADNTLTYTPNENHNGPDSFTYKANDGSDDSNEATVTITVDSINDPPVAGNLPVQDKNEDENPWTVDLNPFESDVDNDGTDLDWQVSTIFPPIVTAQITDVDNDTLEISPVENAYGSCTITLTLTDTGGLIDTQTMTVILNPINDAPEATDDTLVDIDEDIEFNLPAPGVLGNDSDVDLNVLSAELVAGPSHGTLRLNSDGSFSYTSHANYNGPDSFTYNADDGTDDSNVATVHLTVNPVNDAPVAEGDSGFTLDEDGSLTVEAAEGVLVNDTDTENDTLTAVLVRGPANRAFSLEGHGGFSFTPVADFNGPVTFTYRANDGTNDSDVATVTITVDPVNDAPVAADDSDSTDEDTPLTIHVLQNDADIENDPLTIASATQGSHGRVAINDDNTLTYTPDDNYNGPDTFTYRANDGNEDGNEATVNITVTSVNDPPVAEADSGTTDEDTAVVIDVLANDSDPVENSSLTPVITDLPGNGTLLVKSGNVEYTPNENFNGGDSFKYRASDGTDTSNEATVHITVNPVNDAPVIYGQEYISTPQNTPLPISLADLKVRDIDLTYPLDSRLDPVPGTYTLLIADGANYHVEGLTIHPAENFHGYISIPVQVDDGDALSNERDLIAIVGDAGKPCSTVTHVPSGVEGSGHITISYTADDVFTGEDCGNAHSGSGVEHVVLYVKRPSDEAFAKIDTDSGDKIDNSFRYEMVEEGRYYFYTRAIDKEDNREDAPLEGFDADVVYADKFSGYAILAVGHTPQFEDQNAYGLLANNIYGHMLNRNFSLVESAEDPLDHIKFFNPDNPFQAGVDDYSRSGTLTYKEALKEAVTQWAFSKISTLPGALYIVLTGGRGPQFESDGLALTSTESLTASDLDEWLDILEGALGEKDKELRVVIVLGFDNSGSFIGGLSQTNRVIVTSTEERGISYRGPPTPEMDHLGDLFLATLFNQWAQTVSSTQDDDIDADLNSAFEIAVRQVEEYTDQGDASPAFPYFDTARQHPLLDDNGKAPGTHELNPTSAALDSVFNHFEYYDTGTGPVSSVTGDFKEDGHDDLAVVNHTSQTISVFLSNGDRTFATATQYETGDGPVAVTTGDFDQDGDLDLVVANSISKSVTVLLGDGAGGFEIGPPHDLPCRPSAIACGDVDGDEILDLVITDTDANGIRILRGDGSAGFSEDTGIVHKTGVSPAAVATADLNGDGKLDLAVVNTGDCPDADTDCDGFIDDDAFPTDPDEWRDSDGDGTGDNTQDDDDGDGCLDEHDAFPFDPGECEDTDGDGIGDNADTDHDNDGMPDTWEAEHKATDPSEDLDGDGITNLFEYRLGTDPRIPSTTDDIDSDNDGEVNSADADDDGDGILDLEDVFPFNNGEWSDADQDATGDNADPDDDNDGMPDAWEIRYSSLDPYSDDSDADPDGDGAANLDEYLAGTDPELSPDGNVAVLIGSGDSSFLPAVYYARGHSPTGIAVGDFNRDNRPDLAIVQRNVNLLTIFSNRGDALFENGGDYETIDPPAAVATGHFNPDAFLDIAVVSPDADGVYIFKGTEAGQFPIRRKYNTGKSPSSAVSGAFSNGDAFLAVTNHESSSLSILSRQVIDDDNRPNDGTLSKSIFFGHPVNGVDTEDALPAPIRIVEAGWAPENSGTPGSPLEVGQNSALIWAEMEPSDIGPAAVWVTIRPPRSELEQDSDPIVLEWNEENGRFETTYSGFTLSGRYRLLFSAQSHGGFISSVVPPDAYSQQASNFTNTYQESPFDRYLHKKTSSNDAPYFNSYLNVQGQDQVNIGSGLLLAWSSADDSDRDDKKHLTYNIEIWVQGSREFSQTGIKDNYFIFPASILAGVGNDQIMEIRIVAVDEYGEPSDPMVAVTKADNSTGTPLDGLLRGFVYNRHLQAVTEGYVIIPGKEHRKIRTGGYYVFPLPASVDTHYTMIIYAPDYVPYAYVPVKIEQGETTTLNFELTAIRDTIDSDGDGVLDINDNCPDVPNADQANADGDEFGDACDPCSGDTDSDHDGWKDCVDQCPNDFDKIEPGVCGCRISDVDTDGDGIPDCQDNDDDGDGENDEEDEDWKDEDDDSIHDDIDDDDDNDGMDDTWEKKYGLDPTDPTDAGEDPDNDGSDNLKEFLDGTDPTVPNGSEEDSDGDGIPDYRDPFPNDSDEWEDTDHDGIGNNADTDDDNDGMPDTWEIEYGLDPLSPHDAPEDPDGDGTTNLDEYLNGTNPINLRPHQPALLSPFDGEEVVSTTPMLASGNFSDPDLVDTHAETRWQIGLDADFTDLAMDITTSDHLTSLEVPVFILSAGETYYLRIQFIDSQDEASAWSETTTFSVAAAADVDMPVDQQVLDAGIDYDNNGVPDIDQDDMECVLGASNQDVICIKVAANVLSVDAMMWIDPDTVDDLHNRPLSLPMGLISFKLSVAPGDSTTITIYLPTAAPESADLYKYDLINGWRNFAYFAHFSDDRMSVALKLSDGGLGDADGAENGSILDPAGTGTSPAGVYRSYNGIEGNSQFGCFVDGLDTTDTHPALFILLLAGTGLCLHCLARKKKRPTV